MQPSPDPPDSGDRISKQKSVSNKSMNTIESTRPAIISIGALRKAEAIERDQGAS